jgi:hypothetical protein
MSYPITRSNGWFLLLLVLCFVILVLGILSGCTRTNQQLGEAGSSTTGQSMASTGTYTPALASTSTTEGKEAFDTRLAQRRAAVATAIALTPQSPYVPFSQRTQSPEPPTPTWEVGYFGGLDRENTFNPAYDTCWNGYLNGDLLELCAGHEQLGGDPEQGVILLRVYWQDQVTIVSDDVYETPNKVGSVHIVTASSDSVMVASEDGQHTFTFDIATRQWVLPPATPSPTTSPLSATTMSP